MRKNTLMLLESYKNVVFDFDGVLSQSQADDIKVFIPNEMYIMQAVNTDLFMYSRAPKTIQDYVEKLSESGRVYVLSTAASSFEQKWKCAFIEENYPTIHTEDIMFVALDEYKEYILKARFAGETGRVIMVDDTAGVIQSIEKAGIRCVHISALID